jgi:hypothetical protein
MEPTGVAEVQNQTLLISTLDVADGQLNEGAALLPRVEPLHESQGLLWRVGFDTGVVPPRKETLFARRPSLKVVTILS